MCIIWMKISFFLPSSHLRSSTITTPTTNIPLPPNSSAWTSQVEATTTRSPHVHYAHVCPQFVVACPQLKLTVIPTNLQELIEPLISVSLSLDTTPIKNNEMITSRCMTKMRTTFRTKMKKMKPKAKFTGKKLSFEQLIEMTK